MCGIIGINVLGTYNNWQFEKEMNKKYGDFGRSMQKIHDKMEYDHITEKYKNRVDDDNGSRT